MSDHPSQQKPRNPIQEQVVAEMTRRTNELKTAFAALEDGNVRDVPEAIFVRDFLPLFSGDPSVTMEDRRRLLQTWYLIAGTPNHPVNVVDMQGVRVVQVPAILDPAQLDPTPVEDATRAMNAKAEEATQASRSSPRLGDAVLSKALAERLHNVAVPREPSPAWQAIFDHYKVGPKYRKAKAADTPNGAASKGDESDFDMDLL